MLPRFLTCKSFRFFILLSILAVAAATSRAQIITYNFGTSSGVATPSTDTILTIDGGAATMVNFASVAGSGGSGLTTSSASSGYTLNADGTPIAASGSYQLAGNQLAAGSLNLSSSSYIEITLTPTAGSAVAIDYIGFGARVLVDPASPTAFSIYSSADGYAASLASQTFTQGTAWRAYNNTVALNGAIDEAVTLRIYLYGSDGSSRSGNVRIDDLTVAVPEPSTYVLLGLGAVAALAMVRRRRA